MKSRLSRARARLRERLTRRGLAPADSLDRRPRRSAGPLTPSLVAATTRTAFTLISGTLTTVGVVSASVATLTQGVIRTMIYTRLKLAAATLLLVATGSAALLGQVSPREPGGRGTGPVSSVPSRKANAPSASDEQVDLAMLERAWPDAVNRRDAEVVNRILADDFEGIDQAGNLSTSRRRIATPPRGLPHRFVRRPRIAEDARLRRHGGRRQPVQVSRFRGSRGDEPRLHPATRALAVRRLARELDVRRDLAPPSDPSPRGSPPRSERPGLPCGYRMTWPAIASPVTWWEIRGNPDPNRLPRRSRHRSARTRRSHSALGRLVGSRDGPAAGRREGRTPDGTRPDDRCRGEDCDRRSCDPSDKALWERLHVARELEGCTELAMSVSTEAAVPGWSRWSWMPRAIPASERSRAVPGTKGKGSDRIEREYGNGSDFPGKRAAALTSGQDPPGSLRPFRSWSLARSPADRRVSCTPRTPYPARWPTSARPRGPSWSTRPASRSSSPR